MLSNNFYWQKCFVPNIAANNWLISLIMRVGHWAYNAITHSSKQVAWAECLVACLLGSSCLWAQNGIKLPPSPPIQYQRPKTLQYTNMVYNDAVRSIIFAISDHGLLRELSDPFIPLGGGLQLSLSFDEMGNDARNYSYTVVHCTHDWQPSNLDPFDYIEGFMLNDITDYRYSFALTQPYVHYRLELPNANIRFTKSGNYLLKIYANDSPNDLVLTRRFVVYENQVGVSVALRPSTATRFFQSHQRLEFSIGVGGWEVTNPIDQLNITVLQNSRWDNAVIGLKPTFINARELVYSPEMQTTFAASNEFRFADLRTIRSCGARVARIDRSEQQIEAYLQIDNAQHSDTKRFHLYSTDLNGKYFIGINDGGYFNRLDADYLHTHFTLPMQQPVPNARLYVFGALSDWDTRPNFELKYNPQIGAYEGAIWLKQGFYDYQYAFVQTDTLRNKPLPPNTDLTEGNYFATENVYYILTYFRAYDIFAYDRVIGFKCINSGMGTLFDVNYRCD